VARANRLWPFFVSCRDSRPRLSAERSSATGPAGIFFFASSPALVRSYKDQQPLTALVPFGTEVHIGIQPEIFFCYNFLEARVPKES
jgi:hypothetical protein